MKKLITIALVGLTIFTGCITVNIPLGGADTGPSFQWHLRWEPPIERGNTIFPYILRIKDFDASGNYQLSGMVVSYSDGRISESSNNRWATRPGAMLSEMLSRDLQATGHYPAIFRTATSLDDLLSVEGYVREFGATRVDSTTWKAVLDVDVTLLGNRGNEILLQQNYRYEKIMPETGFKALTEQMSFLGALWSEEVMTDIEAVLLPTR